MGIRARKASLVKKIVFSKVFDGDASGILAQSDKEFPNELNWKFPESMREASLSLKTISGVLPEMVLAARTHAILPFI